MNQSNCHPSLLQQIAEGFHLELQILHPEVIPAIAPHEESFMIVGYCMVGIYDLYGITIGQNFLDIVLLDINGIRVGEKRWELQEPGNIEKALEIIKIHVTAQIADAESENQIS